MKDYTTISNVYFIGIGGIGMSALAKYYLSKNAIVSGYDKTVTTLTRQMESEGINIHYEDSVDLLTKDAQLVVYTPAVPKDHKEFQYYLHNNYKVIKRSSLVGEITKSSFNICIAGTHGKTTISTMVAHILRDSDFGCNAFLGGISGNYDTNFWSSDNNVSVVEADEYDRSFLQLSPDVAVISAMDADHLDIYGTKENMDKAFVEFSERLKPGGLLLINYDLSCKQLFSGMPVRYSLKKEADVYADNIIVNDGGYTFDVIAKSWTLKNIQLNMGGVHNVENVVAAIIIAYHLKIDPEKIKKAVNNFKGVKRRFEYIIAPAVKKSAFDASSNIIYIDDYAHHPQELNALISGAKSLFPGKKCTIIFQPHLFSRTKDFAEQFAESLDKADEIFILPIYPARESPMAGVTSELIAKQMKNRKVRLVTKDDLIHFIENEFANENEKNDSDKLLITAGAGDIDKLVDPIKNILLKSIK